MQGKISAPMLFSTLPLASRPSDTIGPRVITRQDIQSQANPRMETYDASKSHPQRLPIGYAQCPDELASVIEQPLLSAPRQKAVTASYAELNFENRRCRFEGRAGSDEFRSAGVPPAQSPLS